MSCSTYLSRLTRNWERNIRLAKGFIQLFFPKDLILVLEPKKCATVSLMSNFLRQMSLVFIWRPN